MPEKNVFFALARVLFVVLLPNVVLYSAAQWLEIGRPAINFDYVVVALVALFLPFYVFFPLLFFVFFIDVVTLVGQVFPFLRFGDVFYLTGFIGQAPVYYQMAFFIGAVLFLLLYAW